MASDFITKLRMNNLFNPGNMNPLGPPQVADPMDMFQKIYPYIVQEKQRDFENQKALDEIRYGNREPKLKNIADSMAGQEQKPMNVVFKPPISEFQQAELGLKREGLKQGEEKIQQTGKLGEEKIVAAKEKSLSDTAIKKQRADIYAFKATHPNMKIVVPKGGNITAIDPITGKAIDTGIDSGTLSDEDRIELTGEKNIEAIGERGNQTRKTQELRGNQALEQIGARVSGQKEVNADKFNLTGSKSPSELETYRGRYNNAVKVRDEHPEWSKYIEVDPATKSYKINPTGDSRVDEEIRNYIYGNMKDIELKSDSKPSKKPSDPLGLRK